MFSEKSVDNLTVLVRKWQAGDIGAFGEAFNILYEDIRAVARSRLTFWDRQADWRTTVLVNESFVSLAEKNGLALKDRNHFLHLVGLVMHRLLVDDARKRKSAIHGGDLTQTDLDDGSVFKISSPEMAIAVNEVIEKMKTADENLATILILRCFAGYTNQEVADILGMALATYNRRWKVAKAILLKGLPVGKFSG